MASSSLPDASRHHTLTTLITPSSPANTRTVYPNDDTLTTLLASRSRLEMPYTRVGASGTDYVVINPLRMLGCMGEETRKGYQKDVEGTERKDERGASVYDLAGRVWMLMHRRKESQGVIYHGLTGSGTSTTSRHFTTQVLHLSSHTKAQKRLSDQITYLQTLLESFGNSKTPLNPSASQHGRYLELHFSSEGTISGAKVLPFGLNKTRLGHLKHEERSFHVFYQLLAGASPEERESLDLEDPGSYALLARSGCFRLPGGPFSDDSMQLGELRAAMASLGFKAKHVRSVFTLLATILLLSNLTFTDDRSTGSLGMTSMDERARVEDRALLAVIAGHLGVSPEHLEAVLVNRTKWVRRDLCSMFLDSNGAALQRDSLMRDLYAILFTFIVEMANKRLAPPNDAAPELQIVQLDLPGYSSRTISDDATGGSRPGSVLGMVPLVNASGQNGFQEYSVNFMNEMVHSYVTRRAFEDDMPGNVGVLSDGIRIPEVTIMGNPACLELMRGGLLGSSRLARKAGGMAGALAAASEELKGEERDEEKAERLVDDLNASFGRHGSYIVNPSLGLGPLSTDRHMFGINHYSGTCSYDATDFVDGNADVLDKQLVDLLRGSADSFISKLVSGPGLATEGHPLDSNITVEAQVSVGPMRVPTSTINPLAGTAPGKEVGDWPIDLNMPQPVISQLNACLSTMLETIDKTRVWNVACIRSNDSGHPNSFDKRRVKAQLRALMIPELIQRRQIDWIADYELGEFCRRHDLRSEQPGDEVLAFGESRGWVRGVDYELGRQRVWFGWSAWKDQEDLIRSGETRRGSGEETLADLDDAHTPEARYGGLGVGRPDVGESSEDLLLKKRGDEEGEYTPNTPGEGYGYRDRDTPDYNASQVWSEYPNKLDTPIYDSTIPALEKDSRGKNDMIVREKKHVATEVIATTSARRWWLRIVWLLTWWIPSFCLSRVGKMDRADIRLAWREKVAIVMMIGLLCGVVIFYIVVFGMLLCPNSAKAWNVSELAQHAGTSDYYAAIAGKVYDFTKFYKGQHSDMTAYTTSSEVMLQFAGMDLTNYFPPPMTVACPGLVTNDQLSLMRANFTPIVAYAVHTSGPLQTINGTKLDDITWYENRLMPDLEQYYKGAYVFAKDDVASGADSDSKDWAIYKNKVYDLSDYIYTVSYYSSSSGTDLPNYSFLDSDLSSLFTTQAGQDITEPMQKILDGMSSENATAHLKCLDTAFYVGETDFRKTARCLVQNYLLLAFSIILITTIAAKFFAALQLGSKRQPELLDKFVICQVPCYTEGEESLKKTIDSLAVLNYDDKRKLIFIICDGNIIGSGNNRPTPRIVLDILGVDPKLDPEPLLFKSIGEGSKQLNYAKVYSGLYEYEGHVVPYVVVVKVGKPTETSKPGNRGKRDSQVLLLQYLNRVHFDAPMSPLELEIYHQMRNVIGIDPTFYEYIFQVDADTTVMPDSLNRLIACTSDDQRIIGICGETKLANERESLTTMIQVYEYYISHHLTKAFESLFGSVTCLPGCFSVYRIRTADKGRPVIISSLVIDEYAEPNVDTLHKKNLFSLGEDRYLTTLMMKHFPTFKMKFSPDAIAHTVAPSRWNVLLSQRRRWINSTVHNLVELLYLPEMCGFCLFSMRFIVFIDLLGTIILPATCIYLIYLIVVVSTGKAAVPVISLAMIGAVYGLQAIIFILKREFMLIGWMFVYILAFPVYSLFLPLYSFWSMDDFSWGNTRQVVGEGNNKTVVYEDDEPFSDSMIPLKSFKDYEANAWETASLHSEKSKATSHTSVPHSRNGRAPFATHRASSMASSVDLPPGADYWRDSSPLGAGHSSRNLRNMDSSPSLRPSNSNQYLNPGMPIQSRVPSMAGMSMWGGGSVYDGGMGYNQPMGMPHPHAMYGNPFASPASEHASLRPPALFPPSGLGPGMVMGAPRNSVMSGLGGYGLPQTRMSSYSLATTANPLGGGPPLALVPNGDPKPSDQEVMSVLQRYLAQQDLMSVTKRQTREAIFGLFPNADLQSRAGWINENIDKILSEA